jgi:hypothetical protein
MRYEGKGPECKGPNFAQTMAIAESMGMEMLTLEDANKIRDDKGELNKRFGEKWKYILSSCYVLDLESGERPQAAYLLYGFGWRFSTGRVSNSDRAAQMVVLKYTKSRASAPEEDPRTLARAD